jgi:uncharacterized protein YgiM (DUF1202 family)
MAQTIKRGDRVAIIWDGEVEGYGTVTGTERSAIYVHSDNYPDRVGVFHRSNIRKMAKR